MPTPYNAPYKVLQRRAEAHRKSLGYPFWISCRVEQIAPGHWRKVPVQGTYRRNQ